MQLLQLQYFCAVAKSENISRTAAELWISQPALSKAIRSLESELDVELFERVGKTIRLNDAGKVFYERVARSLAGIDDAIHFAQLTAKVSSRKVRIYFAAAEFVARPLIHSFSETHPEVQLIVSSYYIGSPLETAECDFLIYASPQEYPEYDSEALIEEKLVIAMNRKHPLAKKEQVTLREAAEYPFQVLQEGESLRANLFRLCKETGVNPHIGYIAPDTYSFLDIYSDPTSLILLPAATMQHFHDRGLVIRHPVDIDCRRTMYLAQRPDMPLNESCMAFREHCRAFFAELKDRALPS